MRRTPPKKVTKQASVIVTYQQDGTHYVLVGHDPDSEMRDVSKRAWALPCNRQVGTQQAAVKLLQDKLGIRDIEFAKLVPEGEAAESTGELTRRRSRHSFFHYPLSSSENAEAIAEAAKSLWMPRSFLRTKS